MLKNKADILSNMFVLLKVFNMFDMDGFFSKVSKEVDQSLRMEEFEMLMSEDDIGGGDYSRPFMTDDI